MLRRLRRDQGFTLIELMVVIIIIAILATIAIPTFLGQREKANDSAAYTLVRNALTAIQTAFVDTNDYTKITVGELQSIEPSIVWVQGAGDLVGTAPASIVDPVGAEARRHEVAFYPESADIVDIATQSASGNSYGMQVNTVDLNQTGYVKVRLVDNAATIGW